jgi:hypothetical protein
MVDIFVTLLLLRALWTTARGRSLPALSVASLGSALFALLALAGWFGRRADTMRASGAFVLALLGPSAFFGPAASVPLSGALGAYPMLSRTALLAILLAGFVVTWRHASRVSPLSDESVQRKEVALSLLAPALLVAFQAGVVAMAASVTDPF